MNILAINKEMSLFVVDNGTAWAHLHIFCNGFATKGKFTSDKAEN
jgi:hypothetical protein